MPQLYYDVLFCSAFIVAIAIMLAEGHSAFKNNKDSYRQILIGLSFLTVFSMIHLVGANQLFLSFTIIHDPVILHVIEATLIASGLIFLLIGLGGWLPSLRKSHKENRQSLKRYQCLKMIQLGLSRCQSVNDLFLLTMNHLQTYMGIPRLAGFKYAAKEDDLYLVGAVGFNSPSPEGIRKIALADTELKQALLAFRVTKQIGDNTVFDNSRRPDIVIPIARNKRLYGSLFIWSSEISFDDDYFDFLSVIANTLSERIESTILEKSRNTHRLQRESYDTLSQLCNRIHTVQQLTQPLFRLLHRLVGAEFMTIADLDNSGENMFRYSIGAGGRMLLEKRVSRATKGTEVETVFRSGVPILHTEIDENASGSDDGLFLSCGMKSKLVCPIMVGKKVMAVVILGHTEPNHFSSIQVRQVRDLLHLTVTVFEKERLQESIEVKDDQMIRLQLLERNLTSGRPLSALFEDACDILTNRMKCTISRISLIDKDRKNLISQSWQTIRDTGQKINGSETIPLSLLPWHRMTMEENKPMLINQDDRDSRMLPQESAQTLLPNIKSAMLIPVKLGDKVQGIISIGEVRNWNRRTFNAADLVLAKDIAAKCSTALKFKKLEIDKEKYWKQSLFNSEPQVDDVHIRSKIKSPLTAIMGAVELLKTKAGAEDEFTSRYHNLILKSAERIRHITERESEDSPEPISIPREKEIPKAGRIRKSDNWSPSSDASIGQEEETSELVLG